MVAAGAGEGRAAGMYLRGANHPMGMVEGVGRGQLDGVIDELVPAVSAARPCSGLQNSADGFVVSGKPESGARVCGVLSDTVKDENGQTPENLLWRLDVEVGFHHPAMLPAVAQVAEWADACGLDVEQARGIAHNILMDPVDWVAECRSMAALGVRRILEIGPSGGVAMLTQAVLDGEGIEMLDVSGAEGKAVLFGA